MSVNNETSSKSTKHHLIIESILCIIIIFMLVKCTPEIKVDTNGNVQDIVQSMSLTKDGSIVISQPDGKVISTSSQNKNPIQEDRVKRINSIVLVTTDSGKRRPSFKKQIGFIDKILSPAMAGDHNRSDHVYYNLTTYINMTYSCRRYDITENWKYVGACI